MSEEIQKIKEEANEIKAKETEVANYELPKLEITDEDKTKFAECLATGKTFSSRITNPNQNIDVTFRDKTKREGDIVTKQIDALLKTGKISNAFECSTLYNLGCLYYQLEEINGVRQERVYPKSAWSLGDFDLFAEVDASPIGAGSSTYTYILSGLLSQFNTKLLDLSSRVFDPDFSDPAKDS